jgi:hypothetical protein
LYYNARCKKQNSLLPNRQSKCTNLRTYNRVPEDELSGSKHVEDIKNKILIYKRSILLVYIV